MQKIILATLCVSIPTSVASAQTTAPRNDTVAVSGVAGATATAAPKIAVATRIKGGSVNLNGKLDDPVWASAQPLSDFVQKEPVENAAPTNRLEVRFLYDDDALYVGTRVINTSPRQVQAPVTRRDNISQAEHIWISLDSYRDRRTAYSFGVTASGVRGDWYHPSDNETNIDASFDPVWEAASDLNSSGWTSEMRIPFSQLRFNAADVQNWGLNIDHWTPNRNEDVFWVPVPRKETGWSSRMGSLVGIQGIKPARRLELMPYVSSDATLTGDRDRDDPFDDGRNLGARVGGDLKMGLGPSLTLQATVNPDFGQVEADPAEVNLSAFETFFPEKRPFFIEGSQLLRGAGSYFYSRRFGARPRGFARGAYVDYPNAATILGATKVTGRLASGASIGALAAVTAREHARTFNADSGSFASTIVAPLSGYGVGRLQKEFG
nr:carbohydrate binding family 9 domain-containing protein [Solirubrobacterales bacterium]